MNFKALSFYARGLNGPQVLRLLRNYIISILALDLVCLQEYKLRLAEVDNFKRYL